jgi:RNase P/RNase MRP subunit POP5
MRPRHRYVAFGVSGAKFSKGEVTRAITNSLRSLQDLGDTAAVRMIFFEAGSGRGLLRCGHKQVAQVKTAILKLKQIGDRDVSFSVFGVSGTIRAAKRKFLSAL